MGRSDLPDDLLRRLFGLVTAFSVPLSPSCSGSRIFADSHVRFVLVAVAELGSS
jgi:hypothetical protein